MAASEKTQTLSFEECAFSPKREQLAGFLTDFLVEEKDGYVLNLNGSWGVGKTHFLKMWETELKKDYPVVYIDAWKTDFAEDPLLVVVNSILQALKEGSNLDSESEVKIMKAACKILKPTGLALARMAAGVFGVEGKVVDDTAQAIESVISDSSKSIFEDYRNQLEAISDFHKEIKGWVENYKSSQDIDRENPVFVLVDELDRCRPNYAIELLETVKHMFDLPNFIFVIATDTEQLQHSIKAVYGQGFNSPQYLTRFFDRSFELPKPDVCEYLKTKGSLEVETPLKNIIFQPLQNNTSQDLIHLISDMSRAYDLTLRDIDKLVSKLQACLRYLKKDKELVLLNVVVLIHCIVAHQFDKKAYRVLPHFGNNNEHLQSIVVNGSIKAAWLDDAMSNDLPNIVGVIITSFSIQRKIDEAFKFGPGQNKFRQILDNLSSIRRQNIWTSRLIDEVNGGIRPVSYAEIQHLTELSQAFD